MQKSSRYQLLTVGAVTLLFSMNAFIAGAKERVADDPTESTTAYVQAELSKVKRVTPPIGAIIAYVPKAGLTVEQIKAQMPTGYMLCDGSDVTDPDALQNIGPKVPDLTDDCFLMGVKQPQETAKKAGRNDIEPDGSHAHGGGTDGFRGYQNGEINYSRGSGHGDQFMMRLGITSDGTHRHGGDKTPRHMNVMYIIRVK